jgi:hypothetical protein
MPDPDTYSALIARLGAARAAQAAAATGVWEWYAQQCQAANEAVIRAEQQVTAATEALSTAQTAADFTGAEAARLWRLLGKRMSRRGLRDAAALGPTPGPDSSDDLSEHPARLLEQVRERLDEVGTRRRRGSRARVGLTLGALLVLAAAVVAAVRLLR